MPLLGAKEGIAHICLALLDQFDVCLAADPGYPVYTTGPMLADGHAVHLPLLARAGFQPDLEAIEPAVLAKAKMIFVGYPNNPTGAVIEDDFFARLVAFAEDHDLVVVHDNAYADITFDGYVAPSFLETPGAKDVGVELFSLSKSYNMTGWRAGAIVGNQDVGRRLLAPQDQHGLGHVRRRAARRRRGAQRAAGQRRRRCAACISAAATCSSRRCAPSGCKRRPPKGTIYLWVPVPAGHTSASFAELVLDQADVIVSPGSAYGPCGEGYVRLSLTVPDERLEEAVRRIEERVKF